MFENWLTAIQDQYQMTQEKQRSTDTGSLAKGLRLLTIMQQALQPLSLSDIADLAGLPPSSAHRLIKSLCDLGYVYQNESGRYGPAPRTLLPLTVDHPLSVLRRDSLHVLESLRTRYGPSAELVVFVGHRRFIVDVALGFYNITPYFDTHDLPPYHVAVSGKLLLSSLSPAACQALLGSTPYAARTRYSMTEWSALSAQLQEIRDTGFATNFNENVMGVSAVGVRLTQPAGKVVGAIVLTGPNEYFEDGKIEQMREDLLQTAELLSRTSQSLRSLSRFLGQ